MHSGLHPAQIVLIWFQVLILRTGGAPGRDLLALFAWYRCGVNMGWCLKHSERRSLYPATGCVFFCGYGGFGTWVIVTESTYFYCNDCLHVLLLLEVLYNVRVFIALITNVLIILMMSLCCRPSTRSFRPHYGKDMLENNDCVRVNQSYLNEIFTW